MQQVLNGFEGITPMTCSAISGDIFGRHDRRGHPECHDRLVSLLSHLPGYLKIHEPEAATQEELERVHVPGYLTWLEKQCTKYVGFCMPGYYIRTGGFLGGDEEIQDFIDSDTYITPSSYKVATWAAGSAIAAVNRSLDGEYCFALVRPPGHHAEADRAMGFCLLNNAAVAAAHALTCVDRVAIVDWDVHHGNGTQNIFYSSNRVLYCSVHQKDIFPQTGFIGETGRHEGTGYTINAPLDEESGIADYSLVFREIFTPALHRFKPDLVIISAGQDILSDDPLGSMNLGPRDIGSLAALVRDAGDAPLALVLEGGYGPSHPEAIRCIFDTLNTASPAEIPSGPPGKNTTETVNLLKKLHGLS